MKKILAIILACVLLFCFCSCNDFKEAFEEGFNAALNEAKDSVNSVSRGEIDGNIYKSDFSSLTFTKPSDWVYSTDEEIATTMNAGAEILDKNSFEQTMASMQTVYDMMVIDYTSGTNMSIQYENLALSNSTSMTEEKYFDTVEGLLNDQDGIEVSNLKKNEVTLSGQKYLRGEYTLTMAGQEFSQVMYIRKIDIYMNVIIVTLVGGEYTTEKIETMFS